MTQRCLPNHTDTVIGQAQAIRRRAAAPAGSGRRRLWWALAVLLLASPAWIAAAEGPQTNICRLLGGRSDRNFAGRPGNLYAEVGKGPRLIYMAGDLSVKSKLLEGSVLEWRPDYVQLRPGPLSGPEGAVLSDVTAEKFCWIGPQDTLLVEHVLRNTSDEAQTVRFTFDLTGVEDVRGSDGRLRFQVAGGYPRSVLPQLVGALAATQPLTCNDGRVQMDAVVPAGRSLSCVVALAFGPDARDVEDAARGVCRPEARQESTRYWNQTLTAAIPRFACSDSYLEKLYYFRWWSLLTKLNVGGYGRWSQPLAREGTVGFNALITYSGGPNTTDLRWLRSPDWAYGNVRSFYTNLHDGKLANHIYPDHLDGDVANRAPGRDGTPLDFPYHNFLVKALVDLYALHPDTEALRQLWPAVQQATGLYDAELDADHDGFYETYPWSNITGQEWSARFLYFHPFDQLLSYERRWHPGNDREAVVAADQIERGVVLWPGLKPARTVDAMCRQVERDRHYRQESVDANCYAYADLQGMAAIAEILGDKQSRDRWQAAAERTRKGILARLWDPQTGFFYDRDAATKEWARVKSPTGFYPFWAGIATKQHLAIFKHLFNPAEFWTPYPLPTLSLDYPKLAGLQKLGWTYWNVHNWPMTTSHVVDAAARAAKDLAPALAPGAAELLMKYTRVQFIGGDLQRPCVSEYFDPVTGQPNAPNLDYGHSYFIDLVLRHVAGIEASPLTGTVRIHPLNLGLTRFEAENVRVKGHDLTVRWRDGILTVLVDGKQVARRHDLSPLSISLKEP